MSLILDIGIGIVVGLAVGALTFNIKMYWLQRKTKIEKNKGKVIENITPERK